MKQYIKIFIFLISIGFTACTEIDENFKKFLTDGETIYRKRIAQSSLKVAPGILKAKVEWQLPADVGRDSIILSLDNNTIRKVLSPNDSVIVLNDLEEKTYELKLLTKDKEGNKSLPATTAITPLGPKFIKSLSAPLSKHKFFLNKNTGAVYILFGLAHSKITDVTLSYTKKDNSRSAVKFSRDRFNNMTDTVLTDIADFVVLSARAFEPGSMDTLTLLPDTVRAWDEETQWSFNDASFARNFVSVVGDQYTIRDLKNNPVDLSYPFASFFDILVFSGVNKITFGARRFDVDASEIALLKESLWALKTLATYGESLSEIVFYGNEFSLRDTIMEIFSGTTVSVTDKGDVTAPPKTFLDKSYWYATASSFKAGFNPNQAIDGTDKAYLSDGKGIPQIVELIINLDTLNNNTARVSGIQFEQWNNNASITVQEVKIETSTDSVSWVSPVITETYPLGDLMDEVSRIEFTEPVNCRYIRFTATERKLTNSSNHYFAVKEIEAY